MDEFKEAIMMDFLSLMLDPLREMLARFREFVPNLLAMLVIFAVGIVLAIVFRMILVKILSAVKFDSWSDRMGFTTLMRKGDLWAKPSYAAGAIIFWVLIIITLMVGLGALRVAAIDHLVDQFFS